MALGKRFSGVLGWICVSLTRKQCVGLGESPSVLKNILSNSENMAHLCSQHKSMVHGNIITGLSPLTDGSIANGHQAGAAHEHPAPLSLVSLLHKACRSVLTLGLGSGKAGSHAE